MKVDILEYWKLEQKKAINRKASLAWYHRNKHDPAVAEKLKARYKVKKEKRKQDPGKRAADAATASRYNKTQKAVDSRRANYASHRDRRRLLIERKKDQPCQDCGKRFPTCAMDFDHRDGDSKAFTISKEATSVSLEALISEIKKCDVVCANCHRVRTHLRALIKQGNRQIANIGHGKDLAGERTDTNGRDL